jgi:hypothetical protein
MTDIARFRVAKLAQSVENVLGGNGRPIFKSANLLWSELRPWEKDQQAPIFEQDDACIYALVRNHGRSHRRDIIEYIGITKNPHSRFYNHAVAQEIVKLKGTTSLAIAPVNFISGRNNIRNRDMALQEIEHILIWAAQPRYNIKKNYTLPGLGKNRGHAWHIINGGYRFAGQLPIEIIYPWMLFIPGRNRALRTQES